MSMRNTEFGRNCTHALEIRKLSVLGSPNNAAVELAHVVVAASVLVREPNMAGLY